MKLIVATIAPFRLESVRSELRKAGIDRLTVLDGQEFASEVHSTDKWKGPKVLRKIILEVAVNDDFVQRAVDTIKRFGHDIRDATEIFVMPIHQATDLTGKAGPEAI